MSNNRYHRRREPPFPLGLMWRLIKLPFVVAAWVVFGPFVLMHRIGWWKAATFGLLTLISAYLWTSAVDPSYSQLLRDRWREAVNPQSAPNRSHSPLLAVVTATPAPTPQKSPVPPATGTVSSTDEPMAPSTLVTSPTPTSIPTMTLVATQPRVPTETSTPAAIPIFTSAPAPSITPTPSIAPAPTLTSTATPTPTPANTLTHTPTPTRTATPLPTATPTPKPSATPVSPSGVPDDVLANLRSQMLDLINTARDGKDLRLSSNAAAQNHAEDMKENCYFSHDGLDGSQPSDRYERAGGGRWRRVGENIFMIGDCPKPWGNFVRRTYVQMVAQAHQSLMGSPGHRGNILRSSFDEVALGFAYDYPNFWVVQLFITR